MWLAVCIDAARAFQGSRVWPQGTIELDSRRGGMLYAPSMNLLSLKSHFQIVLPICLAAAAASQFTPQDKKSLLFSIAKLALNDAIREISSSTHENLAGSSSISRGHLEAEADIVVILGAFTDLAASPSDIQSESWALLIKYIISEVSFGNGVSTKFEGRFSQTLDLLDKMIDNLSAYNCFTLWLWLWIAVVYLIHKSLPGFFDYENDDGEDVIEGSFGFCICPRMTRNMCDPNTCNISFSAKLAGLVDKLARSSSCTDRIYVYSANLLSTMGLWCASAVDNGKISDDLLAKVTSSFASLVNIKYVEGTEELHSIILNDLTAVFFLRQRKMGRDDTFINTVFNMWRILTTKYPEIQNKSHIEIQSLYFKGAESSVSIDFMKSLINSNIMLIKSDPAGTGKVLASKIFPAAIIILKTISDIDDTIQLILSQLLFLYFTTIEETQRALFIATIIPVICGALQNKNESSSLLLFCGKGLTHLARTCQDAFKESIILLSTENRVILQTAMAAAVKQEQLLQQQSGSLGDGSGSGGGGQLKKLDLAKFQKSTTNPAGSTASSSSS